MTEIKVLDHGYIRFIEAWGHGEYGQLIRGEMAPARESEAGIIEAARQSTQGSFRGWEGTPCICPGGYGLDNIFRKPVANFKHLVECGYKPGDADLLEFLYSHSHFTPFEFAGMVIEVQAPIFVFREWQRHRTQSYNEMSARYTSLPDLYYKPTLENVTERINKAATTANKQSASFGPLMNSAEDLAKNWLYHLHFNYLEAENEYQAALACGIPKELARLVMPVGHYSRMRASANLRNWLQFLTLRCDPAAQWEIRQFANAVSLVVKEQFPRTWELWSEVQKLD